MTIRIKKPHSESILLMFFLLLPVLRDFIFSHIPMGYALMDVILVLMIMYCAFVTKRRPIEYIDIVFIYLTIFLLFLFKFIGDDAMSVWLTREFGVRHMFIMCGLFGYGVIRVQDNNEQMLDVLKNSSIVLFCYYAYRCQEVIRNGYWEYYQFGKYWKARSNMSWSYGVLLSICLMSIYIIVYKKYLFIVPISIGLLGILAYGSRGTVVAFAVGIVLAVLFVNDGKLRNKNYILLVLLIIFGIFLFSETGLSIISRWFQVRGLKSKFLELLTVRQSFDQASNGRAKIWRTVIGLIGQSPIMGYGVFGERNAVYSIGYPWGYSHNIILEMLVSFGCIVGGGIIILFLVNVVRFFRTSIDIEERLIFVIFLAVSFELMVSSTIWLHYSIWCLLGLLVNHFKRLRKINKNKRLPGNSVYVN